MKDRKLAERIERTWLESEQVFAKALARLDPSRGTEVFDVADGAAVLCGPGLFVNRAMGLGISRPVTAKDLDLLEERSAAVGVPAALEVTELSVPSVEAQIIARGYTEDEQRSVLVLALDQEPDGGSGGGVPLPIVVETIGSDDVQLWQETAAIALEIPNEQIRQASDLFAATASEVDKPGLMIARSPEDGRPLGCATLKIHNGMATLGGMSTIPAERRKGVQAALVTHRLRTAKSSGCEYAISSAETGSTSERNLIRRGFQISHTKRAFSRDSR